MAVSINARTLFFSCLFLYDCFFVFHLITFYSAKEHDDHTYQPFYGFPQHRLPLDHPIWLVYVHASCALPLVVGSIQFLPSVRKHAMWLHKLLGWIYAGIYTIGAIGPLYMTSAMHCSNYLKAATWVLGIAWGGSVIIAVAMVKVGGTEKVVLHRQWMARSFLISHTIPLLVRGFWIVAVVVFGVEEVPAFELTGWMIVVITVPLAELMAYLEVSGKGYVSIIDKRSYNCAKRSSDKKKE